MNYAMTLKGPVRRFETVIFPNPKEREIAIMLAFSDEGGYEDCDLYETSKEATHEGAYEWFNQH